MEVFGIQEMNLMVGILMQLVGSILQEVFCRAALALLPQEEGHTR
jgi:hypothetical protein